jgi:hypothetical protein
VDPGSTEQAVDPGSTDDYLGYMRRAQLLLGGPRFPEGRSKHLLVLSALLPYADSAGRNMRPMLRTLAVKTLHSRRQVWQALVDLEAWKFLEAQRTARKATNFSIGPALRYPGDLSRAYEEKAEFLDAQEKERATTHNKLERQKRRQMRAIVAANKHIPRPLAWNDDGQLMAILPAGLISKAERGLAGEGEWDLITEEEEEEEGEQQS